MGKFTIRLARLTHLPVEQLREVYEDESLGPIETSRRIVDKINELGFSHSTRRIRSRRFRKTRSSSSAGWLSHQLARMRMRMAHN